MRVLKLAIPFVARYSGKVTEKIGRYEIERPLGHGALGRVYLAFDPKLGRRVAVKVLATHVEDASIRKRFHMEARAIATLKHPNIVQLYDYSSEDDTSFLYLVMEYVNGTSLREILEERGPICEQTALCVGHELARALMYAHERHVVHRDIKPDNVILCDGRVVLVDFGAIKIVRSNAELGVGETHDTTQALGTPGFMAPEQFLGKDVDVRTDIFALGALLYNITTDNLPYHCLDEGNPDAMYRAVTRGAYRDPRDFQPLLTPEFSDLLGECLARRPNHRFQESSFVLEGISKLLEAHGITRVEEELIDFEKNPAATECLQQTRSVATLIRDLKAALIRDLQGALKQRDSARTRYLLAQIHYVEPLDAPGKRLHSPLPTPMQRLGGLFRSWQGWFTLGILVGLGLALLIAATTYLASR